MWILEISGDGTASPDVVSPEAPNVSVYGKIYRCEYKEDNLILYLKQAVLPDFSQNQQINHIRITCRSGDEDYLVSDQVCVTGDLKRLQEPTNPGQFNVRAYYDAQKVSYTMWEPEIKLISRPQLSFMRGLSQLRTYLSGQYDTILPNQYGALLKGISLGDKTDISEEITELFQTGGISHILAISALHLQVFGSSLYNLLRKCRVPIWLAALISGGVLLSYGILTGASVATLRALIIFFLHIGADVTGRTYDGATGIAAAAVVLTAGNPSYLLYSGFWLSFFAVCSFIIFKEKRKLSGGILLFVFMTPLMLIYFYELTPYSILLNLFVVPTIGIVLISGILGCLGSIGSLIVGKAAAFPAVLLLHIYKNLCEISEQMPGSTLIYGQPGWAQVLLYYGCLMGALYFFRKNRMKKIRFAAYFFMIPAWIILTYRGISGLQITMLDVGQGDSMVIQTETGSTYLIDGGSTSEEAVGKYTIVPYLKYSGIDKIDAIFLTHADSDHMNGVQEILEMIAGDNLNLSVEKIILPSWLDMSAFSDIYTLANLCEIDIYRFKKGGVMKDGEMVLTCLHPDGEDYRDKSNEGSLVLRLDYREFSMLFTGDLEGKSESELLGIYGDIDVLKVAHHGSENSTSTEFLQEVQPEICLISCGENNRYGHPHEALKERLEKTGTRIFQTSLQGALTIRTDGERIDLKTYKRYNTS